LQIVKQFSTSATLSLNADSDLTASLAAPANSVADQSSVAILVPRIARARVCSLQDVESGKLRSVAIPLTLGQEF
jgi:hypothetical protein